MSALTEKSGWSPTSVAPSDGASPVRLLALGSPHGDDRLAWSVVDRLQSNPEMRRIAHRLKSPWELLDHLQSGCRLLLLDACESGAPAGAIHHYSERDLDASLGMRPSTHAGTVREALALARALGRTWEELRILAVEIDSRQASSATQEVSSESLARLEQAARRVLGEWGVP